MSFLSDRYDFHLQDAEDSNQYLLEVACPRYLNYLTLSSIKTSVSLSSIISSVSLVHHRFMDTTLIDCDVQPTYVRLTMKGKVSSQPATFYPSHSVGRARSAI